MADGSDLTRWNVARSLAGDILAAVADEDRRGSDASENEDADAYDYRTLLNDHPDQRLPSKEALRIGVGMALCAVDERHLDFSMDDGASPTTRSRAAELASVDDRDIDAGGGGSGSSTDRNDETATGADADADGDSEDGHDAGSTASLWTRAVNLLARWLMSDRSPVRVTGVERHRLNSWNEARHLASQFVRVDDGEAEYEEATDEWPHVTFPPEETVLTVVRDAASTTENRQRRVDEVARWVKSVNWLERDDRDRDRIAMGGGGGRGVGETPSEVLEQTDQLTLSGDVKRTEADAFGRSIAGSADVDDETADGGDDGASEGEDGDDAERDGTAASVSDDAFRRSETGQKDEIRDETGDDDVATGVEAEADGGPDSVSGADPDGDSETIRGRRADPNGSGEESEPPVGENRTLPGWIDEGTDSEADIDET